MQMALRRSKHCCLDLHIPSRFLYAPHTMADLATATAPGHTSGASYLHNLNAPSTNQADCTKGTLCRFNSSSLTVGFLSPDPSFSSYISRRRLLYRDPEPVPPYSGSCR